LMGTTNHTLPRRADSHKSQRSSRLVSALGDADENGYGIRRCRVMLQTGMQCQSDQTLSS
jgi:hypothetical protein